MPQLVALALETTLSVALALETTQRNQKWQFTKTFDIRLSPVWNLDAVSRTCPASHILAYNSTVSAYISYLGIWQGRIRSKFTVIGWDAQNGTKVFYNLGWVLFALLPMHRKVGSLAKHHERTLAHTGWKLSLYGGHYLNRRWGDRWLKLAKLENSL